jgi:hypothetical protein
MVATNELPCVASREVSYPWKGRQHHASERYFFFRSPSDRIDTRGWQEGDKRWLGEIRWWSLPDLLQTPEPVRPPGLAALALALSQDRVPASPVVLPA